QRAPGDATSRRRPGWRGRRWQRSRGPLRNDRAARETNGAWRGPSRIDSMRPETKGPGVAPGAFVTSRTAQRLEVEPHSDAQDARGQDVRRGTERGGIGGTVAAEDRPGVERVEEIGSDLHRGASRQLDPVREAEVRVEHRVVALVVEMRRGQRTQGAVGARIQAEDDGIDVALPCEQAGADLEVPGELVEAVHDHLPARVEEDVSFARSARAGRELS